MGMGIKSVDNGQIRRLEFTEIDKYDINSILNFVFEEWQDAQSFKRSDVALPKIPIRKRN